MRAITWAAAGVMLLSVLMQRPWMPGRQAFLGWNARSRIDMRRHYGLIELRQYGPEAVPAMARVLGSSHVCVRFDAVGALGDIGGPGALPLLFDALQDEATTVQSEAARALARIGDRRAVPPLLRALNHWKSYVRFEAAWALARLGNSAGVPELIARLDTPRIGVLAEYALRDLTRESISGEKAAWEAWWASGQLALRTRAEAYAWASTSSLLAYAGAPAPK